MAAFHGGKSQIGCASGTKELQRTEGMHFHFPVGSLRLIKHQNIQTLNYFDADLGDQMFKNMKSAVRL
jgi:hypothetical protein